eukprot:TRINITY_DN7080_c0_g2_i2.p1 TRINITY_DN7080_c0_g2~~TRINITY_DN7080_c0_g2_i2.p1  ORF type:complete len:245 (+),score=9.63 TRINITY_DN7080_c0_g2_i2:91-825(+)
MSNALQTKANRREALFHSPPSLLKFIVFKNTMLCEKTQNQIHPLIKYILTTFQQQMILIEFHVRNKFYQLIDTFTSPKPQIHFSICKASPQSLFMIFRFFFHFHFLSPDPPLRGGCIKIHRGNLEGNKQIPFRGLFLAKIFFPRKKCLRVLAEQALLASPPLAPLALLALLDPPTPLAPLLPLIALHSLDPLRIKHNLYRSAQCQQISHRRRKEAEHYFAKRNEQKSQSFGMQCLDNYFQKRRC